MIELLEPGLLALFLVAVAVGLVQFWRRRSARNDETGAESAPGGRLALVTVAVAVALLTVGGWYLAAQAAVREAVAAARPSLPLPGAVSGFAAAVGVDLDPFERAVLESVEAALADGAVTALPSSSSERGMRMAPVGFVYGQWDVGVRPGTSGQPFHRVVHFDVFLDEVLLRLDPSVGEALERRELRLACTFRATDESLRSAVLVRRGEELAFEEVHPYAVLDDFLDYTARPSLWPEAYEVELAPRTGPDGR
jgi:hypothetical protein